MKKLLLTIILALVSTSAMAEWTKFSEEADVTSYVDFATIRKLDDRSKVWVLLDYKTAHGEENIKFLSMAIKFDFDCKEEQERMLSATFYSENMMMGKSVHQEDIPDMWRSAPPNTFSDLIMKLACGKK